MNFTAMGATGEADTTTALRAAIALVAAAQERDSAAVEALVVDTLQRRTSGEVGLELIALANLVSLLLSQTTSHPTEDLRRLSLDLDSIMTSTGELVAR